MINIQLSASPSNPILFIGCVSILPSSQLPERVDLVLNSEDSEKLLAAISPFALKMRDKTDETN